MLNDEGEEGTGEPARIQIGKGATHVMMALPIRIDSTAQPTVA